MSLQDDTQLLCEQTKNSLQSRIAALLGPEAPVLAEPSFQSPVFAELDDSLWTLICLYEGETFQTFRGLDYTYRVKGHELIFSRKAKTITRATVLLSFHTALMVMQQEGYVRGPKKLGTFGASYLYPIFLKLGIICSNPLGLSQFSG